jgi:DNA-binding NarL/FixJ family response regulator
VADHGRGGDAGDPLQVHHADSWPGWMQSRQASRHQFSPTTDSRICMMRSPGRVTTMNPMTSISVLVGDDHAVFADALQARLARECDLGPVTVAYSGRDTVHQAAAARPAVVILDVGLGDRSGLDLIEDIHHVSPDSRVIMLTAGSAVEDVVTALTRGARAWLPKTIDSDRLVRVVRGVHRGEAWLSPELLGLVLNDLTARATGQPNPLTVLTDRERQVLQCMMDGLSRPEIAIRLGLSANTVRTHTQNLIAKLGVHSTLEAVGLALRHGLRASGSGREPGQVVRNA